jgi:hypothetical protein
MIRAVHLGTAVDQEQAGHFRRTASISFADVRPVRVARDVGDAARVDQRLRRVALWRALRVRRAAVSVGRWPCDGRRRRILAALVALRGLSIDPSPSSSIDRDGIRRAVEAAGCAVDSVSRPWTRSGRRFVQIQIAIADVRQPQSCGLLAWSSYSLTPIDPDGLEFQQTVGPPPKILAASPAGWNGTELVAFKLHAPSRIRYQNIKRLDGTNGEFERGNILTWEQRLNDRLAGTPV